MLSADVGGEVESIKEEAQPKGPVVSLPRYKELGKSMWIKARRKKLKENRTHFIPDELLDHRASDKVPALNILILLVGTRGDVQPFLSLGQALQKDGHRVRIGTHETFRGFVRSAGLEFYPIGGDPADLMAYMVKNPGVTPSLESIRSGDVLRKRNQVETTLYGAWAACVEDDEETGAPFEPDAIIANPVAFGHVHCAEKLNIPLHIFFTMPWSPTRNFAHPLSNVKLNNDSYQNELSFYLLEAIQWNGLADIINHFRVKKLKLAEVPVSSLLGMHLLSSLEIPHTYCWSPSLVPKPKDWGKHIDICGYFFMNLGAEYRPSPELEAFLNAGPSPVYIGFGSIVIEKKEELVTKILDSVAAIPGLRAIVSSGWGGLASDHVSENIFFIGDCPHDWLFQHVSAVVCHGGAGTTATALRCGKPVFVIPFFGDQRFWGNMVWRAKAGPAPIHNKKLTVTNLVEGLKFCLLDETRRNAKRLGDAIIAEDGIAAGLQSFYSKLPLDMLRCDMDHSLKAELYLPSRGVKLSLESAEKLVRLKVLHASELSSAKRWRPKSYHLDSLCAPSGLISGIFRGGGDSSMRILSGCKDLVAFPVKGAKRNGALGAFTGVGKGLFSSTFKTLDAVFVFCHEMAVGTWNSSEAIVKDHDRRVFEVDTLPEGFFAGHKHLIQGFFEGITGVVELPYKHARRDGLPGLGVGFVGGLVGLASKPPAAFVLYFTLPERGIRTFFRQAGRSLPFRKKEIIYCPNPTEKGPPEFPLLLKQAAKSFLAKKHNEQNEVL